MPQYTAQGLEWFSCSVCFNTFNDEKFLPLSLGCSHVICKHCLVTLDSVKCPLDQQSLVINAKDLPINTALLLVMGYDRSECDTETRPELEALIGGENVKHYEAVKECLNTLAEHLYGWIKAENGEDVNYQSGWDSTQLTRPMQRKLMSLITCQLLEEEGRSRACRAARSIGERVVSELILQHQQTQQLSAHLWAAVRARGCQFLGPAMQEAVLKLIGQALQDGSAMSRKVLVLFVVQRLEKQFPHASKTAIGHVVQLLYRASCFKVTKRDDESSLMQLKEEFCTYENLRREHDSQVVQIASEAGLRIAPEQWSSLLYGDAQHKSHMQSIIDKLQTPESFSQSVNELMIALQRTQDTGGLSVLKSQFEFLANLDQNADVRCGSWSCLESVVRAVWTIFQKFSQFVQANQRLSAENATTNQSKFKTSMCRDFAQRGACPRGTSCTFAHSVEEMERYRARNRRTRAQQTKFATSQSRASEIAANPLLAKPLPPMIPEVLYPVTSGVVASRLPVGSSASAVSSGIGSRHLEMSQPSTSLLSSHGSITSLVSSLGGTIATSSIAASVTETQHRGGSVTPKLSSADSKVAPSIDVITPTVGTAPVASLSQRLTQTTSESRYGQHRNQQAVVRVASAYQESKFTAEHLDNVDRYQPSLVSGPPPGGAQLHQTDKMDSSLSGAARARCLNQAQMGSQPLLTPQPGPATAGRLLEGLPNVHKRNQTILDNLYRRREKLITHLGTAAPPDVVFSREQIYVQDDHTGHACPACTMNSSVCCRARHQGSERRMPSNVMTPGLMPDQLLSRARAFTTEELNRSVNDTAVAMQVTAKMEQQQNDIITDHGPSVAVTRAPRAADPGAPNDEVDSCGAPILLEEEDYRDWAPEFEAAVTAAILEASDSDFEDGSPSDSQQDAEETDYLKFDFGAKDQQSTASTTYGEEEPEVLWFQTDAIDNDDIIPFEDQPFVSKYGPISRAARMKINKNTAPRMVDALRNASPTPVTAVTPTSRPFPSAYHTYNVPPPNGGTRNPLGVAIANSLPTANIKVERMVGTSPVSCCAEPHTLWSMRQKLESDGNRLQGPQSTAEREQLRHELDLVDQQIQIVSHDEMIARQMHTLELNLLTVVPALSRGETFSENNTLDQHQNTKHLAHLSHLPQMAPPVSIPPRYGTPAQMNNGVCRQLLKPRIVTDGRPGPRNGIGWT